VAQSNPKVPLLKQGLNQKLLQKLSPQQIQLMKLIQLPIQQLEQRIKEELEENPALENEKEETYEDETNYEDSVDDYDNEQISTDDINIDEYLSDDDIPDYRLNANNHSADDEYYESPVVHQESFFDMLSDQIGMLNLNQKQKLIAEYVAGSLDDDGYLRRDLQSIADDLAFTRNIMTEADEVEWVLTKIQQLDPPGVGARTLQECLKLQLERLPKVKEVVLAHKIIKNYFDEFSKRHFDKLCDRLGIEEEDLKDIINIIGKLNPKPGNSVGSGSGGNQVITPDFIITINEGELELSLNARNAPELNVSREYKEMLQAYKENSKASREQRDAVSFVKSKLDSAKWFIDAIKQRQQTLLITMSTIMNYQKEYFLSGDETKLRPMILKDIADEILMDISTVSRVASNKYVQTPYGTFLIKEFFSESMTNAEGEEISTKEIKKILQDCIAEEDKRKPLPDDKLVEVLMEKGYPIARRTIAKYREQLGIPVARLRKEI
jgi:RNA polymerase sigma-54 factor